MEQTMKQPSRKEKKLKLLEMDELLVYIYFIMINGVIVVAIVKKDYCLVELALSHLDIIDSVFEDIYNHLILNL